MAKTEPDDEDDASALPGQLTPCEGGIRLESRPRRPQGLSHENGNGDGVDIRDSKKTRGTRESEPGPTLFVNRHELKDMIRATIVKPQPYNVFDRYKTDGVWQKIAKSSAFENVTLTIIGLNAIWMGVDADWNTGTNPATTPTVFLVGENIFCVYFSIELIVRFAAFKRKKDCMFDSWFVFDAALVTMMVMDTWVMLLISGADGANPLGDAAVIRLLRLLRLTRLIRMLRSLPELMILIRGMKQAMGSVMYVMVLLMLITYVFAIICAQLSIGYGFKDQYFSSVGISMYTLLIYGTFLDALSDICDAVRAESIPVLLVFTVFVCLSALTVMNMLIGVLCEVIAAVASTEQQDREAASVSEKLKDVLSTLDSDNNGMLSYHEFSQIMMLPEVTNSLQEVGVDPLTLADFGEVLFGDGDGTVEIPFDNFVETVLDLRASNSTTVKDVMGLQRILRGDITVIKENVQSVADELKVRTLRIEGMLPTLADKLASTRRDVGELQARSSQMESTIQAGFSSIESQLKLMSERLASAHIL